MTSGRLGIKKLDVQRFDSFLHGLLTHEHHIQIPARGPIALAVCKS